jgi:hypothetical protein
MRVTALVLLACALGCFLEPKSIGNETASGSGSGDETTDAGTDDEAGAATDDSASGSATSTTSSTSTTTGGGSTTSAGTTESGGSTTGPFESCDELLPAFEAEAQEIRACTEAAECGQVLENTSCGCTRNWVARADADVTAFWELVQMAAQLECSLPFGSTCDCPAADGFACEVSVCTWNYL